jgi:GT2 family glycosyltransferase
MTSPDLSVVVVHHRGMEHLLEGLAALETAVSGGSTEIILVDNTGGSPIEDVLRRHPTIRRVAAAENVGFAAGCRLGAETARAPLLLFVNDDAVVEADALERLASALAGAPADVVAVAGRLVDRTGQKNDFSDGFLTFDGHAFQQNVGRPVSELPRMEPGEERLFACGGLMAVRREEFLSSGGFDPDYFAYLEDVDFGWRQWIAGRRIIAEPRAVARHRGSATGEALGVFARGYLIEKNAFATAYKNFDAEHFRMFMPAILATFLSRVAEMLGSRNPGASELKRDPYRQDSGDGKAIARWLGIADTNGSSVGIDDPLTVAHLKALLWIHRNHETLAAKRRIVQAMRRRSDREIFTKFPLRLVATYPGDEGFDSDFFRELLAGAPSLVRTTLAEIFA